MERHLFRFGPLKTFLVVCLYRTLKWHHKYVTQQHSPLYDIALLS